MTLVVGLIGGIGSGKSAVADQFASRGAQVINADHLGHEALKQPEIREAIVARWGSNVLNEQGEIDRRILGPIVFKEEQSRRELEALTHPYIRRRAEALIAQARFDKVPLVIVDAALLLEAGWYDVCDELIFVETSAPVRAERVRRTRGWSQEEWTAREQAQLPLTQKAARADHVLDNSSTLEHLSRQVEDLMRRWGFVPAQVSAFEKPPQ